MKVPFNVRELIKSGTELDEQRNKPVRLAVFVEADVEDALIDVFQAAFRPTTANARLHLEVVEPGSHLIVDPNADAVIALVGSGLMGIAEELVDPRERSIPTVAIALAAEAAPVAETISHPYRDTLADPDPVRLVEEELGEWLVERLPAKRLALANNYPSMRRAVALEAVRNTAWQNAAIGAVVFVPGADMPLMTANQMKMLLQIAAAYGEQLGTERVKELAAVVGGGFLFRTAARQVVAFIPGFGWAIKGGIGATGTLAMGYAAIRYFEEGVDITRLREQFDRMRQRLAERSRSREPVSSEKREELPVGGE